jgi:thiol-disulfide isomerase/thioredoxin
VAIATAALAACAPATVPTRAPGPAPAGKVGSISAAPPGPSFRLQTLDGQTLGPPGPGDPPMVLFAMASWCNTCAIPAGELAQVKKDLGARSPTIVAVDIDPGDTIADLRAFAGAIKDADYHWALDQGGVLVRAFGIRSLDTTIVLAPGGTIAHRSDGPMRYPALRRVLDPLLGVTG